MHLDKTRGKKLVEDFGTRLDFDQAYLREAELKVNLVHLLLLDDFFELSNGLYSKRVPRIRKLLKLTLNADACKDLGEVLIREAIVIEHELFEEERFVNAPVALAKVDSKGLAQTRVQGVPREGQLVVLNSRENGQIMHILVLNAESAIIRIDLGISVIFVGFLLAERSEVLLAQLAFLEYLELLGDFELLFDRSFFGPFLGSGR